jgi:methionyl aminopeptidase
MIQIKSLAEIETMAEGGWRLASVMKEVLGAVKVGVSLRELDQLAESLIKKRGGQPSFKKVKGYHWMTCLNINQGVVHGVPNDYCLKEGDLLSVDMGNFYQGFHTDMARTIWVGKAKDSSFLEAGKKALKAATQEMKVGNRIGHLSKAMEREIRKSGFSPAENLTGHGVGRKLHEDPQIFCYLREKVEKTEVLKPGMVLAIEVIYVQGEPDLVLKEDNWTIETEDGKLAALFENTIAVTQKGPRILTPLSLG